MQNDLIIYLIDDDTDDQEIFSFAMEEVRPDARCLFASDCGAALDKLQNTSFRPQLIFIDINMPRMNGVQCLEEIKKMAHLKHVPVYMYSTSAESHIVQQCADLGAAGYIKKHIQTAEIKKDFSKIINNLYKAD